MRPVTSVEHLNRLLLVSLPDAYESAKDRYERIVPAVDLAAFAAATDWSEVLTEAKKQSAQGFLRYFQTDVAAAMMGSGTTWQATEYLMGNHTIAERMYRHEPSVMLHAPLRTLLYEGPRGTVLAVDQPSLIFASYGNAAIAAVGRELDALLANLLELLGGEIPAALDV